MLKIGAAVSRLLQKKLFLLMFVRIIFVSVWCYYMISSLFLLAEEGGQQDDGDGSSTSIIMACSSSTYFRLLVLLLTFLCWAFFIVLLAFRSRFLINLTCLLLLEENSEKAPLVAQKIDSLAKLLFNKSIIGSRSGNSSPLEPPASPRWDSHQFWTLFVLE